MLTAVLEVSGAVLSWQADDAAAEPVADFTDVRRADWLWRVIGADRHAQWVRDGVERANLPAERLVMLRQLAMGHWLRRWWPASARDGIMALDPALLDAEIALRTVAADVFFTDDTLDSEADGLLAPHGGALTRHLVGGDPRIEQLVRRCAALAADLGVDTAGWPELVAALQEPSAPVASGGGAQADYALAAGAGPRPDGPMIAAGVASVDWAGVPPGVFDAAEDTIDWSVTAADGRPSAAIAVALTTTPGASALPGGIGVDLRSASVTAAGTLDDDGRAVLAVHGPDGAPMTESQAWSHDWSDVTVTVGVAVDEAVALRDRVRTLARARLAAPGADAYLAEILAAESDY